jgi:hypothetical protein
MDLVGLAPGPSPVGAGKLSRDHQVALWQSELAMFPCRADVENQTWSMRAVDASAP